MVLPLIAGAALRVAGGRVASQAAAQGGSQAAGRAMQYGGRALQMSAARNHPLRQQQSQPPRGHQHLLRKAEGIGGFVAVTSAPGLAAGAAQQFDSIMQSTQFKG